MTSPYPTTWKCNYCKGEHEVKYQVCPNYVGNKVKIAIPVKNTVMEIETDVTGKSTGRIGVYFQGMDKPGYTFTKVLLWGLAGADTELVMEGDITTIVSDNEPSEEKEQE